MTPATATTESQPSPVLNLKQAAAYLGVSPASLQRLFSEDIGSAPQHKRVGGVILFRKEWLDEWLEACS